MALAVNRPAVVLSTMVLQAVPPDILAATSERMTFRSMKDGSILPVVLVSRWPRA
ncbi:hypothetical protein ACFY2R_15700 [Micromonospora olivasterospora]|uniref:hypothetical protein n=1 Tax=Micromonospora olivasterospora TaxID=1880 RepID=UPI0031E4728B